MQEQTKNTKRLQTREVRIGNLLLGNGHPLRVQTMTTTDTMDTDATVAQSIRCIEAGAELIRITAPSRKEAENLGLIRRRLRESGYDTPLVADIHFTPNAAEIAARLVEKVRVNPGNYADKKKFEQHQYTDADYLEELERIRQRFLPLVRICREYGTAMRIGTNHGSLSDRIMSRFGDTPLGMVESAMEFLRICRDESFHQVVLSMKSSNPQVMVQAYRLLVRTMLQEFGEAYPLHLGVTEAGDGEDGRIKSAIGIGTLLEDGIGDTIRVSLTEDPELEIPVCQDLVARYAGQDFYPPSVGEEGTLPYSPYQYTRRASRANGRIGGGQPPVVVADYGAAPPTRPEDLEIIGYQYDPVTDKWHAGDRAADLIYTGKAIPPFPLPGFLHALVEWETWVNAGERSQLIPVLRSPAVASAGDSATGARQETCCLIFDPANSGECAWALQQACILPSCIVCLSPSGPRAMAKMREFIIEMMRRGLDHPVILSPRSEAPTVDGQLIQLSAEAGALLLDGMGDGIWLRHDSGKPVNQRISGRTYLDIGHPRAFLNQTAFSILQATRTRISKTEYISCPSCGRTLFDLQETTARIRRATSHLKGVKIAIMGCIVNGPGEMADADFGYVGSGPGRITLYRGKEVVKRSVPSETAVDELIGLLRESGVWIEIPEGNQ